MPEYIDVATQAELDWAVREHPDARLVVTGARGFRVGGTRHVVARERSHVVARERSHVEARGSAHVEARGSAHVEARGSAHVEARERSHVVASPLVAVHQHSDRAVITGGVVIPVRPLTTAAEWCAYYGVPVTHGVAVLYKAVRDDYRSSCGLRYEPGTRVEATDWDGGDAECGGGLHFSPHPSMALAFDGEATRVLACPVALADMRPPDPDDAYPQKVKASRICQPIREVDRRGQPVATAADPEDR